MIPKIFHSVWLGHNPPETLLAFRRSLMALHTDWRHFYLWTERNIASGLGLEPFQYEHATPAGSSNIVRLRAIKKHGGIYLDADVEVLKPFDQLLEHEAFVARQADGPLCNALFGATPDHPWIDHMLATYGDQRLHDAAHGCHIMAGAEKFGVTILPTDTFYPWNFCDPPDRSLITDRTLAVHHWLGSWCQKENVAAVVA